MSPRASAVVILAVLTAVATSATPAAALPADRVGVFPTWSVSGSSGAFTAQPTFVASAAFPATTVTSTGTTIAAPSGVTAFLGAGTALGAEYGSTRSEPYLTISPAAGGARSVTTITFASAPPAGWGFALGDIDADWAFIQAFDGATQVAVADLGFRSVGNYCSVTPRPGACADPPYTDQPVWVTAAETFDGTDYVPGTLRGNSLPGSPTTTLDTSGAYGWFQPTVPITRLEILYGVRGGLPTAQLWLVASAPLVRLTGTVVGDPAVGGPPPAGTVVTVSDSTGAALLDILDLPLQVPVDPSTGIWTADVEQRADGYVAQVVPPPGYMTPGPVLVPGLPANPPDPTAVAPTVGLLAVAAPAPAPLQLAASGASGASATGAVLALAVALLGTGSALAVVGGRRRKAARP